MTEPDYVAPPAGPPRPRPIKPVEAALGVAAALTEALTQQLVDDTPEVYASWCCGGVFVPSYGPGDINAAEEGAKMYAETAEGEQRFVVNQAEAEVADAVRAGECPYCGEVFPLLDRLDVDLVRRAQGVRPRV